MAMNKMPPWVQAEWLHCNLQRTFQVAFGVARIASIVENASA
jgi:hypothetical protein